jgi:hypothetical protein
MRSVARADVGGGLSTKEPFAFEFEFRAERERAEPGVDANEGDRDPTDLEDDHGGASARGTGLRGLRGVRGSSRRGGRVPVSDGARPPLRAELARLPKLLGVAGRRGARAGDAEAGSETRFPGGETRGDVRGGAGGKPSSTRNANGVSGGSSPNDDDVAFCFSSPGEPLPVAKRAFGVG